MIEALLTASQRALRDETHAFVREDVPRTSDVGNYANPSFACTKARTCFNAAKACRAS